MSGCARLVLGAARSGKSAYAERLCAGEYDQKIYLATAQALDREMAERIRRHRARRGGDWITVEEPLDLVAALRRAARPGCVVLIDCLTLWISNLMAAGRDVASAVDELAGLLGETGAAVVIVSNEVGGGIVPDNPLARAFRDHAGLANQTLAAVCGEVVLITAGLPLKLK